MNTIDEQTPTEGTTTPTSTPPHAATEACTATVPTPPASTLSGVFPEEQWQKDRDIADAQDAAWNDYLHPVRTHKDKIVEDAINAIHGDLSLRIRENLTCALISTEDCQVYEVTISAVALTADSALARKVIAEELENAEERVNQLRHMLNKYQQ